MSVVVELLGYLGGTLAVIGAGLLTARFWPDLASWTRLSLVGLVAVALWGAGGLVPEQAVPALWRLRGVLWLGSSAAVAFLAALFGAEVLDLDGEAVALLAGLATASQASVLWWRRPRPLQQLGWLAGVVVAAGAIVVLQGAQVTAVRWEGPGLMFGLASAAGLLVAGTTGRRLALAVVGIMGMVMFLPATVVHFFAGTVGVPLLLLLAGVVLLTITLVLLRWWHPWAQAKPPTPARERPEERSSTSDPPTEPRAA